MSGQGFTTMDAMRRWPLSVSEWPIVNPVPEVAIHFNEVETSSCRHLNSRVVFTALTQTTDALTCRVIIAASYMDCLRLFLPRHLPLTKNKSPQTKKNPVASASGVWGMVSA